MFSDTLLEELMGQLGTWGRYQWKQHILHLLTGFLAGMNMLSLTFVASTPAHRCFIKELDLNASSPVGYNLNVSVLHDYIPLKENGELASCHRYAVPFDQDSDLVSCNDQFVYDKSVYIQSRVYEWNMVCENKWQRALIQSIYVFGVFNGAVWCGALSDRIGRKRILCISAVLQFIFSLAGAYITNYALYCASLFLYGFFGSGGAYVTGFVLSMELVNKTKRTFCGTAFSASFAIGVCFVALWSYLIRDVTTLQTVFACHALLLFGSFWLVDESIRWLWSQGRIPEAVAIVRRACRTNGATFDNSYEGKFTEAVSKRATDGAPVSYGFSDLFRTPNLRFRALDTAFQWFAIALCFYGLAFNTGALPGNPYLVFAISGIVDLPGHLIVILIVDKTGRRSLNAAFLFIGGLACIVTTFIPRGLVVTTIAMFAKIAMAGCFAVIYNYTAELFPTVIRTSAVGLCSMSARFGGMLTPQITLLDSLDKRVPVFIFGGVAIFAAFMGLFLPETLNKGMPQTLEDGENFGKGDTAFTSCCGGSSKKRNYSIDDAEVGRKLKG